MYSVAQHAFMFLRSLGGGVQTPSRRAPLARGQRALRINSAVGGVSDADLVSIHNRLWCATKYRGRRPLPQINCVQSHSLCIQRYTTSVAERVAKYKSQNPGELQSLKAKACQPMVDGLHHRYYRVA